jgi:3-oxoadipate enol-lactonase
VAAVPTAAVRGIDLHYEIQGSGPRLLFLAGSGMTLDGAAMVIAPFAAEFEVLAADYRGLGRSGPSPGPYSMADCAADFVGLLDVVGWDRCAVVGVSFGGMVAQELVVTVPERIERVALMCTSPGGPDTSSFPLHELASLPPEERAAAGPLLMDTRFTPEWLAEHEFDAFLAGILAERAAEPRTPVAELGERLQFEARRGHDVVDRLPSVTCPTLVASGRYDGIAPLVNGEAIAALVPGARLEVFEGGHAFMAQDAAAFPAILSFLSGA